MLDFVYPVRPHWLLGRTARAVSHDARGAATLNGHEMKEGDGAAPDDEDSIQVTAQADFASCCCSTGTK